MFNRNGGPSAAAILHGTTDQSRGTTAGRRPFEVAEVIDQENLPLGDGLQRGVSSDASLAREEAAASNEPVRTEASQGGDPADDPGRDTEVTVVVRSVPRRGGRPPLKERYPFGTISIARSVDGRMEGESFFIPDEDQPRRKLAAARKRHRPKGFISYTDEESGGIWVWRSR